MLASLFGQWWKGAATEDTLILRPSRSAAESVSGFRSGQDLSTRVLAAGETIGQILERLNVYRGPDQILKRVWDPNTGQDIPLHTVVRGTLVAEVRRESV